MTAVDLFSGGGGAALGLRRAGIRCLAHVEWDKHACATLRAAESASLIDGDVIEGDIRTVDWVPYVGVDLVWASPPCQAWSSAGQRLGAQDERNGWPWTWDAVDKIRPTWLICENVGGLLHHLSEGHPDQAQPVTQTGLFGATPEPVMVRDDSPNPELCSRCYWDCVILPEARRRFAHVDWRLLDCADYGMVAACPLHSYHIPGSAAAAAESYDLTTGLAYVGLPAMRSSDEAATRLALDVVALSARAIRSACAADVPAHERLNSLLRSAQRARPTRNGRADDTWMSVGMSESGWTASIVGSIALWLSDFSADPSLQQRWSTTSMETRRTTLRRIWKCIAATVITGACTGTAERSVGCGLCLDWSVPQHRERLILVCGPEPYRWPVPTHRDPGLVHAVGKPWITVRQALGIGVEGIKTAHRPGERVADRARVDLTNSPAWTVSTQPGQGGGAMIVIEEDTGAGFAARRGPRTPATADDPSPSIRAGSKGSGPRMWLRTECTGAVATSIDAPSPSVTGPGNQHLHAGDPGVRGPRESARPDRRRLTPAECAALQSFPPGWPWQGTKTAIYRQIGNAVPPPLAEAIARTLNT